jgi:hypothetical protein
MMTREEARAADLDRYHGGPANCIACAKARYTRPKNLLERVAGRVRSRPLPKLREPKGITPLMLPLIELKPNQCHTLMAIRILGSAV